MKVVISADMEGVAGVARPNLVLGVRLNGSLAVYELFLVLVDLAEAAA